MTTKMEIERKFLVDPEHLRKCHPNLPPPVSISQGYVSTEPVVRARLQTDGQGSSKGFLTIKGKGLIARNEYEWEIPSLDAMNLIKTMCGDNVILKERYRLEAGYAPHVWEIDKFLGRHDGLWVAEIELKSSMERFDIPTWARDEVSNDSRYQNVYMATHSGRFWDKT